MSVPFSARRLPAFDARGARTTDWILDQFEREDFTNGQVTDTRGSMVHVQLHSRQRQDVFNARALTVSERRSIVSNQQLPAVPAAHLCPSCHQPQTKIKRVLDGGKFGSSNFVCSRMECPLAIDVAKLETWVAE